MELRPPHASPPPPRAAQAHGEPGWRLRAERESTRIEGRAATDHALAVGDGEAEQDKFAGYVEELLAPRGEDADAGAVARSRRLDADSLWVQARSSAAAAAAAAAAGGGADAAAATRKYNLLLRALGAQGRFAEARSIAWREMDERGVPADAGTFSALLSGAARARDGAAIDRIWAAMRQQRSGACAAAAAAARAPAPFRTWFWLHECSREPVVSRSQPCIKPTNLRTLQVSVWSVAQDDRSNFNMYLQRAPRAASAQTGEPVSPPADTCEERSRTLPSAPTSGACGNAFPPHMHVLHRRACALSMFCAPGVTAAATGEPVSPREDTWGALLHALVRCERVDDALAAGAAMREAREPWNNYTYNTLLTGLVKQDRLDEAWAMYREMIGEEVERDVHVYTTMMRACALGREFERAMQLMDELEVRGLQPAQATFNALLRAAATSPLWMKAYGNMVDRLRGRMRGYGIPPSQETFQSLLACYGNHGDADGVQSVLAEMQAWALTQRALDPVEARAGLIRGPVRGPPRGVARMRTDASAKGHQQGALQAGEVPLQLGTGEGGAVAAMSQGEGGEVAALAGGWEGASALTVPTYNAVLSAYSGCMSVGEKMGTRPRYGSLPEHVEEMEKQRLAHRIIRISRRDRDRLEELRMATLDYDRDKEEAVTGKNRVPGKRVKFRGMTHVEDMRTEEAYEDYKALLAEAVAKHDARERGEPAPAAALTDGGEGARGERRVMRRGPDGALYRDWSAEATDVEELIEELRLEQQAGFSLAQRSEHVARLRPRSASDAPPSRPLRLPTAMALLSCVLLFENCQGAGGRGALLRPCGGDCVLAGCSPWWPSSDAIAEGGEDAEEYDSEDEDSDEDDEDDQQRRRRRYTEDDVAELAAQLRAEERGDYSHLDAEVELEVARDPRWRAMMDRLKRRQEMGDEFSDDDEDDDEADDDEDAEEVPGDSDDETSDAEQGGEAGEVLMLDADGNLVSKPAGDDDAFDLDDNAAAAPSGIDGGGSGDGAPLQQLSDDEILEKMALVKAAQRRPGGVTPADLARIFGPAPPADDASGALLAPPRLLSEGGEGGAQGGGEGEGDEAPWQRPADPLVAELEEVLGEDLGGEVAPPAAAAAAAEGEREAAVLAPWAGAPAKASSDDAIARLLAGEDMDIELEEDGRGGWDVVPESRRQRREAKVEVEVADDAPHGGSALMERPPDDPFFLNRMPLAERRRYISAYAEQAYDAAITAHGAPDRTLVNWMLKVHAEALQVDTALAFLEQEFPLRGIEPDRTTARVLVRMLCRARRPADAAALELRARGAWGVGVDPECLGMVLCEWSKRDDHERMAAVLDDFAAARVVPPEKWLAFTRRNALKARFAHPALPPDPAAWTREVKRPVRRRQEVRAVQSGMARRGVLGARSRIY
ncbi:hypothetical protein JKP88DRAFT_339919 [Tribonema minus]|uniref:Pentatricopeptide repeat-containing protein n=1 Tax=Tribonema minus TaxID=303371 RepID=A0A836C6I1_9STRA|nr:hypothetical protein JKP88DRAFT_339919 [Tribonema minus]